MKSTTSRIAGLGLILFFCALLLCSIPFGQKQKTAKAESPIVQCLEESLPQPEIVPSSGYTGLRIAGVLLRNVLSLYR